jgi:ComF family protein
LAGSYMAFFETLVSLVAPHSCILCGQEGQVFCERCAGKTVIVKQPTCYRCNRLSDYGQTCASCRPSTQLSGVVVAAYYGGPVKELIHELKYERARASAAVLARMLASGLQDMRFDLVTAVPTDPARRRVRGYNQAELVAKAISKETGLPYVDVLLRVKPIHQVGAHRSLRLEQIKGAFMSHKELFIKDARVLVVDDVVTTGATLAECAEVLKKAGAKQVWGAAVARH